MLTRQLFWTTVRNSYTTTAKFPTAEGEDYNEWTNGANCFTDDADYAKAYYDVYPAENDFYNFNFSINAAATIKGIIVTAKIMTAETGTMRTRMLIELSYDGGTNYTASGKYITNTVSNAYQTLTIGDSTDTWGRTWDVSEFSNANFRMRGTFVDTIGNPYESRCAFIKVEVYYEATSA